MITLTDRWTPQSAAPAVKFAIERRLDERTQSLTIFTTVNRVGGLIVSWGVLVFALAHVRPNVDAAAPDPMGNVLLGSCVAVPMFAVSVLANVGLARPKITAFLDSGVAKIRNPIYVHNVDLKKVADVTVNCLGWAKLIFASGDSITVGLEQPFGFGGGARSEDFDVLNYCVTESWRRETFLDEPECSSRRALFDSGLSLLLCGWAAFTVLFTLEIIP